MRSALEETIVQLMSQQWELNHGLGVGAWCFTTELWTHQKQATDLYGSSMIIGLNFRPSMTFTVVIDLDCRPCWTFIKANDLDCRFE